MLLDDKLMDFILLLALRHEFTNFINFMNYTNFTKIRS